MVTAQRIELSMEQNRASQRRRTLKAGKIVLSDQQLLDCVIRDLSETGAKVEFGAPTQLPKECRLLITSTNQLFPVEVAWQNGMAAGVRFTGPARAAPGGRV